MYLRSYRAACVRSVCVRTACVCECALCVCNFRWARTRLIQLAIVALITLALHNHRQLRHTTSATRTATFSIYLFITQPAAPRCTPLYPAQRRDKENPLTPRSQMKFHFWPFYGHLTRQPVATTCQQNGRRKKTAK